MSPGLAGPGETVLGLWGGSVLKKQFWRRREGGGAVGAGPLEQVIKLGWRGCGNKKTRPSRGQGGVFEARSARRVAPLKGNPSMGACECG